MKLEAQQFIDALDTIVFTYGLESRLYDWKKRAKFRVIDEPFVLRGEDFSSGLEFIWVVCVELFGDWGTTPRAGWIEDIDGFCEFIDAITSTSRDMDKED